MPASQETQLQMAISAYKRKCFKSIAAAAEVFDVSKETLHNWLHGIKPWRETHANGHKLSVIEEKVLTKCLLEADKWGFPIQPEFLWRMAQILLQEQSPSSPPIGINWASKFVKHHPEIQTRYNWWMPYQKAKQKDPMIIQSWLDTVYGAIQEHGIHEDDVWNFDETGFAMPLPLFNI